MSKNKQKKGRKSKKMNTKINKWRMHATEIYTVFEGNTKSNTLIFKKYLRKLTFLTFGTAETRERRTLAPSAEFSCLFS